ncbi:MAG: hypothetical protein JXB35_02265 [Anaerolineae bacterium]|nr:hypothetical protein [Anaerolineae bacterium]
MFKRYGWRILLAVLAVALLIGGGVALYQAGWAQGFTAGQLEDTGEEGLSFPAIPFMHAHRPFRFVPFPLLGFRFLFPLGLLLLVIAILGGIARRRWWARAAHFCGPRSPYGAPPHGPWRYGPWPHGAPPHGAPPHAAPPHAEPSEEAGPEQESGGLEAGA